MFQLKKIFLPAITSITVLIATLFPAQVFAGYLGFRVQNLPPHVRAHMPDDLAKNQGVIVDWLEDISPAADEGMKRYDVLIDYNNAAITTPESLMQKIQQAAPGEKVIFKLVRQGQVMDLPVTITEAPHGIKMTPAPKQPLLFRPVPPRAASSHRGSYHPPQSSRLNIAGKPAFPMRKKPEVHSWGKERNIWPDFYTSTTNDMWDKMINAPFKMGRMPGGWRAPSLSMPDPVTVGDAVTNQLPPMAKEAGNMLDISN